MYISWTIKCLILLMHGATMKFIETYMFGLSILPQQQINLYCILNTLNFILTITLILRKHLIVNRMWNL